MSKVPELKGGQMLTIAYFIGIIIVLFIVYKILAATGLIKTAAKKKEEAAEEAAIDTVRTDDVFDPEFAIGKRFTSLGSNYISKYVEELRKAIRGFGTDEEAIFVVFGSLKNKYNVSEIANGYRQTYNRNLREDLLDELSKEDLATLMKIINKLPNS